MTIFSKGCFETVGGYEAIVAKTVTRNKIFVLLGAVKEKGSNFYVLTAWDLLGNCMGIASAQLNLVPNKK